MRNPMEFVKAPRVVEEEVEPFEAEEIQLPHQSSIGTTEWR